MNLSVESHSPPSKPSSPSSPLSSFQAQQSIAPRSFIHLAGSNSNIRGQSSPFPQTPTSTVSNGFFESPPGVSYLSFVRTWSDMHVARWLTDIKCAHHASTFKENDIRGDILLELDLPTLKEMGIASIGDRLRIANAVKILRQKTSPPKVSPTSSSSSPSERLSRLNTSNLDSVDIRTPHGSLDSPLLQQKNAHFQEGSDPSPTTRLASRSGRPAPLQLHTNSRGNDLPKIARDQQPPDSAKSTHGLRPPLSTTNSSSSLSGNSTPGPQSTPRTVHSATTRTQTPSARTPARNLINNSSQLSGRRTPTQGEAPPAFTAQPLPPAPTPPVSSSQPSSNPAYSSWSNNYHLPSDPRPGNLGGIKPNPTGRSTSPFLPPRTSSRPSTAPSPSSSTHTRSASNGTPFATANSTKSARPTMNHPYAQSSSLQPPAQHSGINLSPIAESFLSSQPPPTPSTNSYAVGRGPFNPANNNSTRDDSKSYIVKFTVPGKQSCKVNIGDCPGGVEILDKVLRKLNKDGTRNSSFERATLDGGGLALDGWSVFMDSDDGIYGEPLSESQILSICRSPHRPIGENELILQRTQKKRNDDYLQPPSTSRATKRASSISILSGLGVADPEKALDPPSPTASSASNQYTSKKPSRLRNFFGQRPPSELITNHLTEYFPFTEKKVLERTARNSMMHRRESTASWNNTLASRFSSSTQGSIGKGRSPRDSISSFAPPPPVPEKTLQTNNDIPRVSLSTDDGRSVDLPMDDSVPSPPYFSPPQLLPPIPFPTETLSQSLGDITGDRSRRASTQSNPPSRMNSMTELRSKKDRSDTASLMTVDEITASVESRRESLAIDRMAIDSNTNTEIDEWSQVGSEDEDLDATLAEEEELEVEVAVGPTDDDDDESDEEADDLEDNTEEEQQEEDEDEEIGKTMTSEGHKWIKGALIGSGSFGKVYLGMDASTGLLMAVKQVELPSGSSANEERKQSMLSALEREIELLKDLQHENIVQYLYSSADEEHLNIFLEYVPGGSVAALLRNYGAFEETLVKNFVRQILLGLQYLHERDIIHRDIKGGNILVDNKGGIKISDFGISKKTDTLMSGNRAHRPSLQGSVFWMAPEVVKQSGHTSKADIWSVGCLVVEMLTGEHPWAQLTQMQAIFKIGSLAKPTIPSDVSPDAQDFLEKTFELNVNERPSTDELLLHPWIAKKPSKGIISKSP